MKGKLMTVLSWVLVAFFALMALGLAASGSPLGFILMLLAAAMTLPIQQVRDLWTRFIGVKQVEDVTEEKAKFWQFKKKKAQKEQQAKVQKQRSRNALKPVIIAVVFLVAMGCGTSGTSSSSSSTTVAEDAGSAVEVGTEEVEVEDEVEEPEEEIEEEVPDATEEEAVAETEEAEESTSTSSVAASANIDLSSIPAYSDSPYAVVNNNVPGFIDDDLTTTSFEYYSDLDSLGRCGVAYACIGQDLMPTEERGSISSVHPSGWQSSSGWQRCHLIGFQLAGENANSKNLITGTQYMNVSGMLPFENMVADYVQETNNHVLYRVTPIFEGNNLVASGVLMEALSVEDNGEDIQFCVYCYNVQPGVTIDYATGVTDDNGTSTASESSSSSSSSSGSGSTAAASIDSSSGSGTTSTTATYILNTNTKKFHYPTCSSVKQMSEKNKQEYTGSRDDLISQGYSPCGNCNP